MRIALVGRYPLDPSGFGGGVEASTAHLIEGLLACGQRDIHVIATTSRIRDNLVREEGPVHYHYIASPARLQTLSWYAIPRRRIRRKLFELQPDVVHAQNSQVSGNICLRTPFPVVVSLHGVVAEELRYVTGTTARLRVRIQGSVLQKSVIRRARHIIQPTRYPESYFGDITTAKWHDTGNAIASVFFSDNGRNSRDHILYSGAVVPRKRLLDLVEAFALVSDQVPGTMLRVAGPISDPEYAVRVRRTIEQRGLVDRVAFLGLLDREQLAAEYAACRVLVLPSGQETSPMVIAEAMASSSPVIATDVGGVRSLVQDGVTGFVVPVGDVAALADRLTSLLTDPELVTSFGKAGYEKARRSFTSEAVAKRVLAVYEAAIKDSAARGSQ